MLQIDPFKSSCSQRKQYPEGTFKAKITPKEQLFGESGWYESHNASAIVYNCFSKISTILYE